jgi:ABC-type dipeptide/oligopeptide/nickel transport system ATPase component
MNILQVKNLSVAYYRGKEVIAAVRDISFDVEEGKTLAIVGESGSGKSTVALSLMGLIFPFEGAITRGEITYNGMNVLRQSPEQWRRIRGAEIALVFQDPFSSLNPVLTVGEQIAESIRGGKADAKRMSEAALAALRETLFDDPERIYRSYPHQLSGGQRQRVAIAIAIINHPRILIADEPTTALDVTTQKDILDLLARLKQELSLTVVFITHNLAIAAMRADRVMIMKAGAIVESGPTADVFHHPKEPYTRELIEAVPRLKAGNRSV